VWVNRKIYPDQAVQLVSAVALASLLLAACAAGNFDESPGSLSGPVAICHATGDPTRPYEEVAIDFKELARHGGHADDIIPAPEGGCPAEAMTGSNDGTISICHATGRATDPYEQVSIDLNGLTGHGFHADDIFPVPESGCPAEAVEGGDNGGKVTICHATGSAKNPYVEITIDVNGLSGHDTHANDIIPAPAGGCPASNDTGSGKGNKKP
jgi:hypothetical protein